ncbi:major facilitator superfamily domain, general substrate transporter [Trichoderma arundinaceum]|uniref:Major facilitator superfamily domain, general substrate transporter n=1 Tax=Trichoderma arundinaceum TaxID=490622 RepID=A0A395NFZ5_TRIAR|nr:major facilitator superfamily domain, general substrate transporter [Trichoderma arundinaceum]
MAPDGASRQGRSRLGRLFGSNPEPGNEKAGPSRWSMGILNDRETVEVPGSVLLLASDRNEPLGLRNVHARTSHSSIPAGFPVETPMTPGGTVLSSPSPAPEKPAHETASKKKTGDGKIILDPQPEDSVNDPLNWPTWRRDCALLSLGFYCMIGGGMTPLIAAGFTNVAHDFDVSVERVPLTTGLYMMGLGLGSVIASPTAILFGKRPVYLMGAILLISTCIWSGYSQSFSSLIAARVFQGVAVSPVECLPSATIAEIFFLHERAYRIGIYTLLLLGGKNLVPLISAAIIGRFGWRWVFFIVAMIVGFAVVLLFLFVPETFWDRTPTRRVSRRPSFLRRLSSRHPGAGHASAGPITPRGKSPARSPSPGVIERRRDVHVEFKPNVEPESPTDDVRKSSEKGATGNPQVGFDGPSLGIHKEEGLDQESTARRESSRGPSIRTPRASITAPRPSLGPDRGRGSTPPASSPPAHSAAESMVITEYYSTAPNLDNERLPAWKLRAPPKIKAYTHNLRHQPAQTFIQQLKPYHGRLNNDNWFKVMIRPFILFVYPAVLWSAAIYACSIGWLIVISENLAVIYRNPEGYNFTALQAGLVYVSPFVGGILGTGVAGKISDIIVRAMARRNGGMYEPEFRLVMAVPILLATCIGLMGFGWSAQEKDSWIVPTIFFGITSFGCSLGSTTSITFCVDSYRQYAGEALVTLNFSKNIFHGLVFSLFISQWLAADGSRDVYIWLGVIQLIFCLLALPLYIYGKRARMWTARMNLMEKF